MTATTEAKTCLQNVQHRQKQYHDAQHRELTFAVGKVWLNSKNIPIQGIGARKLMPLWLGPFAVLEKVSAVRYQLDIPEHYQLHSTFHVTFLKPAYGWPSRTS